MIILFKCRFMPITRGIWELTSGGCWRDVQYIWVATPWLELDVGWWFHFEQRPWKTNMFRRTSFFQCQSWLCHVHRFLHPFFQIHYSKISGWTSCYVLQFHKVYEMTGCCFSGTTNPDYDFHDLRFQHFQGIAEGGWDGSATSAGEGWKSKIAGVGGSCPPPCMIWMRV